MHTTHTFFLCALYVDTSHLETYDLNQTGRINSVLHGLFVTTVQYARYSLFTILYYTYYIL